MINVRRILALAAVLAACKDSIAPKPPYVANAFVLVTSTLSKTSLPLNDTLKWTYSFENITNDSLTLTTPAGCQVQPELDIVEGAEWEDPPLSELACLAFESATVTKLAAGEKQTFFLVLGRYEASKVDQAPSFTYFLTRGTWDASLLVNAVEIGGSARSEWVRFLVQ